MKGQNQRVLELLRERGERGVTPLEALDIVGSFRLGARIYDLKAEGHDIRTERVRTRGGSVVARYVLVPPRPVPTADPLPLWKPEPVR